MFSYAPLPSFLSSPPFSLYDISSSEEVNVAAMKNTDIQRNEVDVAKKHGKILILQFVLHY
jgi:hypothetical protein